MGSDPGTPLEVGFRLMAGASDVGWRLKARTGVWVQAAASGLGVAAGRGVVAPVAMSEVEANRLCPSTGVGVLGGSPVFPAAAACSRSVVELPETESVTPPRPRVGLQAPGSGLEVTSLGTGRETLKDPGGNKPDVPQSKTRQSFKLGGNMVAKLPGSKETIRNYSFSV